MVERNPDITVDEDGQYKKGKIILRTARKSFATEDMLLRGDIRWDGPCIYSKSPMLIRKVFTKIRAGDMLLVKGNLCTQEVTRRATCPRCGNIVRKPGGVITYIDPICIYIEQLGEVSFEEYCEERSLNPEEIALLRKTGLIGITEEQAAEMMQRKVEISNQVYLDGELCREPTVYEDTINHHTQTQFQIAVNRKRYIREDNPEYAAAKERSIPMLSRAELLGQIMDNYNNSIAVAGTHGKTTTTSMISQILLAAKADPTISVGGILKAIEGNIKVGKSDIFVSEACEYTNSFLHFYPRYSVILNVEAEHLDFFKDIQDIRNSFRKFAGNTKNARDDRTVLVAGFWKK